MFFVGFFTLAALAVVFHKNKRVVSVYLLAFYTCQAATGIVGTVWPICSGRLYPRVEPTERKYYEIRVVDSNGQELKYDARALNLTTATWLHRLPGDMQGYTDEQNQELERYLLQKARGYRQVVERGALRIATLLKFPSHQFGFRWTKAMLHRYAEFTEIRRYRVRAVLSTDGRRLIDKTDEQLGAF